MNGLREYLAGENDGPGGESMPAIVYVGFKNGIDWSDGRSYMSSLGRTEEEALVRMNLKPDTVKQWLEGDVELKAYFSVKCYDLNEGKYVKVSPSSSPGVDGSAPGSSSD